MTRDEAIGIVKTQDRESKLLDVYLVDSLVALGMLKLDEPITAYQVLKDDGYGEIAAENILGALDRGGLKIVSKFTDD